MCKNLYFFNHSFPEVGGEDEIQSSKVNKIEAQMVVELTSYLLKQGYRGDDLTVITPYVTPCRIIVIGFNLLKICWSIIRTSKGSIRSCCCDCR
jgi:hypothetical protein